MTNEHTVTDQIAGDECGQRKEAERIELDKPPVVQVASWDQWLPKQPECDLLLTEVPSVKRVAPTE